MKMKYTTHKKILLLNVITLVVITSVVVIFQLIHSKEHEISLFQQQLIQEAKAHFNEMVDTRAWNAQYGGVFVQAKNGIKPNPYLQNNKLLTDTNETLIKINPAWMTRQISDISNKKGSYFFKITSLNPINPANRADTFETKALNYFEKNKRSKYFYEFDTNDKKFNFMGSLLTTKSCLQCHQYQGYKIGDIRGGIRVSVPISMYLQQEALLEEKTERSIIIVIVVALVFITLIILFANIFYKRQYEIMHAKTILERKVSERTKDLEVVISREQHLKDILKIIAEVNELLISSYSTKSTLKNATHKLNSNSSYNYVVSGLIKNNILDVISESVPNPALIKNNLISLNDADAKQHYFTKAIIKAIELKHPIVEKLSQEDILEYKEKSKLDLEWMIVLPLLHDFHDEAYGIITVFSSNKEGFEVEEMKILENMAHDISIALYSHKQKDAILLMEKEKTANYEETILAFVNIIEQRDTYTAGHTIRVAQYCTLIAKEMGISHQDIKLLEKSAILHDIGKVATPDTILLKPARLSHLEYELIKQHSAVGADMLEKISIYKDLANIIRYHHSRYDGKGYPRTSSPNEIPLLSHIMILADAFDAMTTNRIYRPRKSIDEALHDIQAESGTQFHPDVVKSALVALRSVNLSETSQIPTSELEKRRMSYFFRDSLTGLYNEDYLRSILNTSNYKYKCLNLIKIKHFTQYNQKYGWEEGNRFLKHFADYLQKRFPDSTIIRYHGDDFILLNEIHQELTPIQIEYSELIEGTLLDLTITHYDIGGEFFDIKTFIQ